MVEMRKIMSSFACFLTLSCGANIDLNAQSTQYIQHKAHIDDKKGAKGISSTNAKGLH